jgi:hypothetical protein
VADGQLDDHPEHDDDWDDLFDDREPTRPSSYRERSAGAAALGRAMMGLGEIIEGKPPRDAYEYVLEIDDTDEPLGPGFVSSDLPWRLGPD